MELGCCGCSSRGSRCLRFGVLRQKEEDKQNQWNVSESHTSIRKSTIEN